MLPLKIIFISADVGLGLIFRTHLLHSSVTPVWCCGMQFPQLLCGPHCFR